MPRTGGASREGGPPKGPRRHVDRAAQFMPFAALTGYYDLIREREREALRAWGEYGQRRDAPPTPGGSAPGSRPGPPCTP